MTTPTSTDDTGEAIRALVRRLLRPRVAAALAAEQEQAVAPLLGADIAAMLRRLPDRDLLALCAPELRRRLGLDEEEPAPAPVAVERAAPPALPRARKPAPAAPPVLTDSEAAALAPEALDVPPAEKDAPAAEEEPLVLTPTEMAQPLDPSADRVFDPLVYDNHCPGECGELESECTCAELDAEDERKRLARAEKRRAKRKARAGAKAPVVADPAPAPPPRKLPVLPATPVAPAPSRGGTDTPPVQLEVVPVEQLTSGGQRFRCLPFAAVITAATCLERQRLAQVNDRSVSRPGVEARGKANACARCKDCDLGRTVAAQLRGVAA